MAGSSFFRWLPAGSVHGQDTDPEGFSYVVQPGDTLWSLALDFGRDLDTMSCATQPRGPDAETLPEGQTITVPALNDLCYTVTPGDTLDGIAANAWTFGREHRRRAMERLCRSPLHRRA